MNRLLPDPAVEGREAPASLLARLREVDPTAELYHLGGGRWAVGRVGGHNRHREQQALRIITAERKRAVPNMRNVVLAGLSAAGFRLIFPAHEVEGGGGIEGRVYIDGAPGEPQSYEGSVLEELTERLRAYEEDRGSANVYRNLGISMKDPERLEGARRMADYTATDVLQHYRREVRGRRMFGPAGVTGGEGSGLIH
jgi:hypothetical protein